MGWEKGSAFAQCFLMGQFGALSAITWITNDMRQAHDKQIKDMETQIKELNDRVKKQESWSLMRGIFG